MPLIRCSDNSKPEQKDNSPVKTAVGVVISENTAIRLEPFIYSTRVGFLNKGQTVDILEKSTGKNWVGQSFDHWYRIKTKDNQSGWIFAKNMKLFAPQGKTSVDSYISSFWEKESEHLRLELSGKWWSIDELGSYSDHSLEITRDGKYISSMKGGKRVTGEYSFDFNNSELIFSNGTSFGDNLYYVKRGTVYFLEKVITINNEKKKIRFLKFGDIQESLTKKQKLMDTEAKRQTVTPQTTNEPPKDEKKAENK